MIAFELRSRWRVRSRSLRWGGLNASSRRLSLNGIRSLLSWAFGHFLGVRQFLLAFLFILLLEFLFLLRLSLLETILDIALLQEMFLLISVAAASEPRDQDRLKQLANERCEAVGYHRH